MNARIGLLGCTVAVAIALVTVAAGEDVYPSRPIRVVLPFPPGGGIDTLARLLTPKLSKSMGQQWIVDNRTGAAGNIAVETVTRAPPDGYTALLTLSTVVTVNPLLYKDLPFDVLSDLKPVSQIGSAQYVLVVPSSLGVTTVKGLVALAKARPGQLNYASSGIGGIQHFVTEIFKQRTGTDIVHVPYKGGAPATAALLRGEVQLLFGSVASVLPYVKTGQFRALGVSSRNRSAALPDVSTLHEAGIPDFDVTTWYGLFVPGQTPDSIVRRLHAETISALSAPDVREAMAREGQEVVTSSPAELSALIKRELAVNAQIIATAHIRVE